MEILVETDSFQTTLRISTQPALGAQQRGRSALLQVVDFQLGAHGCSARHPRSALIPDWPHHTVSVKTDCSELSYFKEFPSFI